MLPRPMRVTVSMFGAILKDGVACHSPLFTLRVRKLDADATTRISVVVSKKVAKTAVDRNRNRRRVNAGLVSLRKLMRQGFAAVIFVKKNLDSVSVAEIASEVKGLLLKASIVEATRL